MRVPISPVSPSWCKAAAAVAVTDLVIAPVGGVLKAGRRRVTADPTLATARSIEFDAVVVATGTTPTADIKLVVAAAGGVPALQGDRLLGRQGHRPQSCANPDQGASRCGGRRPRQGLHRKPGGGAEAAPCMGPSRVGHGLGGSPCPLTHGDKPHINDPSGPSDRESVKRLTISARRGRPAAVASFLALRVSRLRLSDPIFER